MEHTEQHRIVIVGSGFSGVCLGIKLRRQGITDFVILEKAATAGGTWRDNQYPGAECDVPSALYSFSFETRTDWNYQWSEQPQILQYIHNVVDKNGLDQHLRFGCEVNAASFNSESSRWTVSLTDGRVLEAQFLITAVGQLHIPQTPTIEGAPGFAGIQFHSARWDHQVDLAGKSVAVVGNAASAAQFIPHIAREAGSLVVYQRSANWVSRKLDRPYRDWEKKLMRLLPIIKAASRLKTYLRNELIVYPAINGNRLTGWLLKTSCLGYLKKTVKDEALRDKLTPDYPIGAKRILVAEGYYEALVRDNVELVTEPISHIDDNGINTAGGEHRACDVIIYGTGFVTNPFLRDIAIRGSHGEALAQHWSAGARAYLGVTTSDFPNLFFMYGPNTNLGHNSILLMAEAQANYILQAIAEVSARGATAVEVRREIEAQYNDNIQARLQGMVWNQVDHSWYKSGGLITNNWPGSVGEYRRLLRAFGSADYTFS